MLKFTNNAHICIKILKIKYTFRNNQNRTPSPTARATLKRGLTGGWEALI